MMTNNPILLDVICFLFCFVLFCLDRLIQFKLFNSNDLFGTFCFGFFSLFLKNIYIYVYDIKLMRYWRNKWLNWTSERVFLLSVHAGNLYEDINKRLNKTNSTNKAANSQKHVRHTVVPIRPCCGPMGGITWRQKWSWPITGHHPGI